MSECSPRIQLSYQADPQLLDEIDELHWNIHKFYIRQSCFKG